MVTPGIPAVHRVLALPSLPSLVRAVRLALIGACTRALLAGRGGAVPEDGYFETAVPAAIGIARVKVLSPNSLPAGA